jgi:hypothetical protein
MQSKQKLPGKDCLRLIRLKLARGLFAQFSDVEGLDRAIADMQDIAVMNAMLVESVKGLPEEAKYRMEIAQAFDEGAQQAISKRVYVTPSGEQFDGEISGGEADERLQMADSFWVSEDRLMRSQRFLRLCLREGLWQELESFKTVCYDAPSKLATYLELVKIIGQELSKEPCDYKLVTDHLSIVSHLKGDDADTLLDLLGLKQLTPRAWTAALDEAVKIQQYVCDQTYLSRKKDFDNPFRQMVYSTPEEMAAVLGTAEGNSFVKQVRKETQAFGDLAEAIKKRG